MKRTPKTSRKLVLAPEGLTVDSFPTAEVPEIPQFAAATISNCTRCPSHIDSLCPCCTGPDQCL